MDIITELWMSIIRLWLSITVVNYISILELWISVIAVRIPIFELWISIITQNWRYTWLSIIRYIHIIQFFVTFLSTTILKIISLAFVRGIPGTKGQLRGNFFHLMTSSWVATVFTYFSGTFPISSIFHNLLNICDYIHIRCDMMFADGLVSSPRESCSQHYGATQSAHISIV